MKDILTIADEMLLSVKESEAYKNYVCNKEKIMAQEELLSQIKEFKKLHVKLQVKRMNEEFVDFNEELNVSRKYFSLIQNETAKKYFLAEQELLSLLSEIYFKLGKQCNELLIEF